MHVLSLVLPRSSSPVFLRSNICCAWPRELPIRKDSLHSREQGRGEIDEHPDAVLASFTSIWRIFHDERRHAFF